MKKSVSCNSMTARRLIFKKRVRFDLKEKEGGRLFTLKRFDFPFKTSMNLINKEKNRKKLKVASTPKIEESNENFQTLKRSKNSGFIPKSQMKKNSMVSLNNSKASTQFNRNDLNIKTDLEEAKTFEFASDNTNKILTCRPKMLKNKFSMIIPKYQDPLPFQFPKSAFLNLDKLDRKVLISKIKQELNDNINCVNRKTLRMIDPAFARNSAIMTPCLTPNKMAGGACLKTPDKKRFRSLIQKPLCIKFLNKRMSEKLEHMCMDSVDIDKNIYDEFINKLTQNFFKKKPNSELETVNIDTLFNR